MTLQNAFGNIALDASVQQVKTAVDAIVTTLDNGVSVSGSTVALDAPTLAALETITANTGGLTDAQLRATALPVTGTFWQVTQPISALSLPLPTGAATQTTLAAIDTKLGGTLTVTGTVYIDSVSNNPVSNGVQGTDVALTTHSVITGETTAGGGGYVNVKVNPSGALAVSVGDSALPTGAATNAKLDEVITAVEGISGGGGGLTDAELRASPLEIEGAILTEIRNLADSVNTLVQFLYANSPRIDALNRMAVNGSETTQPVSGTVTATVANATVSTVTTLSNITSISGQPTQYLGQDVPLHIYDNIKVT